MSSFFDIVKTTLYGIFQVIATVFHWIIRFLNYEISSVGSNPLTVGKLLLAIGFICFGIYLVRKLVSQIEKRVLERLDVERPVRDTIRTVIFYFLNLILFLFILRMLNIPITVLTVVGGAVAFAVGLGAQNIVYDLLSGFVIVLEHPVRKGDLIEIDNIAGRVEDIGTRATRLLTLDNKHLIVPNNFLLSKTILNWTLSDEVIRSELQVGVTYGTSTADLEKIMYEVASAHSEVKKDPPPKVIFDDFGNDALIFKLSFFASIDNILDLRRIKSDLRFSLSKAFKRNNIAIAFPQRDIHFKGDSHPVKVEILSEKEKNN